MIHFIEQIAEFAETSLPANCALQNFFKRSHATCFVQVSHFGSITVRLPATAVDGPVTFCDPPTGLKKKRRDGKDE